MYRLKDKVSETQIGIIFALADCGLKTSRAARKVNMHRNTVIYHIEEIKKFTGLDPLDFYDMVKLLKKIQKRGERRRLTENCGIWHKLIQKTSNVATVLLYKSAILKTAKFLKKVNVLNLY